MARLITPLSEVKCSSAKPKVKDYKLFDGVVFIYWLRPMVLKAGG
ncbi:hypothetical protein [Gilliamella apis]|nr:hypothetical protein [Gilliamella apis]